MTEDQRRTLFEPDPLIEVPTHLATVVEPAPSLPPALGPTPHAEPSVDVEEPVVRRPNPWVLALWVAAAVLVIVSVWASTTAMAGQYVGYSSSAGEEYWTTPDFIIDSVKSELAPGGFAIGLACALAATFVHALQWMRRHP